MGRKRFRTPSTLPEETLCRGLVIPASQDWLGIYNDALLSLTEPWNYVQVNDTDLSPAETAAAAYEQFLAWLESTCTGGDCPPAYVMGADGLRKRVYRRNPTTGHIEQLEEDETWQPPSGDDAIPTPSARQESTSDDRKCAAATNAANVIKLLYADVDTDINNSVDAQQIQINIATGVSAALALALGNPTLGSIALALGAFSEFVEIGQQIVLVNLWSEAFHKKYLCTLLDNATDTNGVVTFDFWEVNRSLLGQGFTGDYLYLILQILYLHHVIGADGLNLAGATTAIVNPVCGCAPWGRRWEGSAMHTLSEWSLIQGTVLLDGNIQVAGVWVGRWAAVQCNVTPSVDTTFMKVGLRYYVPTGGYFQIRFSTGSPYWVHSGGPDDAPSADPPVWYFGSGASHANLYDYPVFNKQGTGSATNFIAALRQDKQAAQLTGIEVYGTGPCPFSTGTVIL